MWFAVLDEKYRHLCVGCPLYPGHGSFPHRLSGFERLPKTWSFIAESVENSSDYQDSCCDLVANVSMYIGGLFS